MKMAATGDTITRRAEVEDGIRVFKGWGFVRYCVRGTYIKRYFMVFI